MKTIIFAVCLTVFFVLTPQLFAQPIPPSGAGIGGHGTSGNQPAGAPLDGGFTLILLMAAGYGGRMLIKAREKKEEESL
ncbi:MAG: hypothetical protein WCO13_05205 [Bacteroidota bacterium]